MYLYLIDNDEEAENRKGTKISVIKCWLSLDKGNLIICCTSSQENYFGSVGLQNNYPKFPVCASKSKNIDHRVKETCTTMSTQVTSTSFYLWFNNIKLTNFFFFFFFSCISL